MCCLGAERYRGTSYLSLSAFVCMSTCVLVCPRVCSVTYLEMLVAHEKFVKIPMDTIIYPRCHYRLMS